MPSLNKISLLSLCASASAYLPKVARDDDVRAKIASKFELFKSSALDSSAPRAVAAAASAQEQGRVKDYQKWPARKSAAAASSRTALSRLGGRNYDVTEDQCAPFQHTDTCWQAPLPDECESFGDRAEECPEGNFCFQIPGVSGVVSSPCPEDGIDCITASGCGDFEGCEKQCLACCAKQDDAFAATVPLSCKSCLYDAEEDEPDFDQCNTCAEGSEIVVATSSCTGACLPPAGVEHYKQRYGVAGLAESACTAIVNCYDGADRAFIESLPTDGTNDVYPGEDDDAWSYSYSYSYSYDLFQVCWEANDVPFCANSAIEAGEVTEEEVLDALNSWAPEAPTDDPSSLTCEGMQEWSFFADFCSNPMPVPEGTTEPICTPEWFGFVECFIGTDLWGLDCTDQLSCAAAVSGTPEPTAKTSELTSAPSSLEPTAKTSEPTPAGPPGGDTFAPTAAPIAKPIAEPTAEPTAKPIAKPPSPGPDQPTPTPTKKKKSDGATALMPTLAAALAAAAIWLV